jgi:hypothetical protein
VPVTVESERDRRVAGEHSHVPRVRALSDPEGDGGVTKIVRAEWLEARGANRGVPEPTPP